jgi:hypothetical protein
MVAQIREEGYMRLNRTHWTEEMTKQRLVALTVAMLALLWLLLFTLPLSAQTTQKPPAKPAAQAVTTPPIQPVPMPEAKPGPTTTNPEAAKIAPAPADQPPAFTELQTLKIENWRLRFNAAVAPLSMEGQELLKTLPKSDKWQFDLFTGWHPVEKKDEAKPEVKK